MAHMASVDSHVRVSKGYHNELWTSSRSSSLNVETLLESILYVESKKTLTSPHSGE